MAYEEEVRHIGGELHPSRQPGAEIVHDGHRGLRGAIPHVPGGDKLRIPVYRRPRPNVTPAQLAPVLLGHVAILRAAEGPDLVRL